MKMSQVHSNSICILPGTVTWNSFIQLKLLQSNYSWEYSASLNFTVIFEYIFLDIRSLHTHGDSMNVRIIAGPSRWLNSARWTFVFFSPWTNFLSETHGHQNTHSNYPTILSIRPWLALQNNVLERVTYTWNMVQGPICIHNYMCTYVHTWYVHRVYMYMMIK